MDDESLNEILRVLKSTTRRRVLELLLENPYGLRFSEIAKTLEIYPSTLEKHLEKLVKSGVIAHHERLYLSTVYSGRICETLNGFLAIPPGHYLSTHTLLLDDPALLLEFRSLRFEVIPDLISIVNRIRKDFDNAQTLIQAGGQLDYSIGRSVYEFGMLSHRKTRVEVILTERLIDEIREQGNESLFLSQFDEQKTQLYAIQKCSLGIGVSESSGFLFLPGLDFEVDFHKCLYTGSREGVAWLKRVFGHLKKQARAFNP